MTTPNAPEPMTDEELDRLGKAIAGGFFHLDLKGGDFIEITGQSSRGIYVRRLFSTIDSLKLKLAEAEERVVLANGLKDAAEVRWAESVTRHDHTKQWYAERLERITDLAKEKGIWTEVACIIANGTRSIYDPPTYAQQLNIAKHRAESAERERDKMLAVVVKCAATFREYAELHRAKNTADGDVKARRNEEMMTMCAVAAALTQDGATER